MKIHELRIYPEFFESIRDGSKTCEIRYNDRGFKVGDILCLREISPVTGAHTGRWLLVAISHITGLPEHFAHMDSSDLGLRDGFVVLSIHRIWTMLGEDGMLKGMAPNESLEVDDYRKKLDEIHAAVVGKGEDNG
jgi:hypothetical protein